MVHKKFTMISSFFLGLLFVMHIGLMGTSAHAHQDKDVLATLNAGRKLMMVELKVIVREGPNIKNGGISKISGAIPSDGNCTDHFEGKGDLNGKSKLGDKSDHRKMGGHLVAFSADYNMPKRHPPIHN